MDTNPRYTVVGIVVVLILIGLGFWVAWLWRGDTKDRSALYLIYFSKQSLSGLQVDSIVTMRGIKVGSVKEVIIQPDDIERVKVTIAISYETPVRTDTRAVINRNLLTGLALIDLVGSTQSARPLLLSAKGQPLPVIEEGQTGLDKVQQSIPELVGKASTVLDQMSALLSTQNIETISRSLQNAEQGTVAFSRLGEVVDSADQTLEGFSKLLRETEGKISPALTEFAASIDEIRSAISVLSSDLAELLRSATATSNKLREPRSAVLGLPSGKLGPGEEKVN